MLADDRILVARGAVPCELLLSQACRHGLVTGASGTGKTVTLKVLMEGFSDAGVPVFVADVKGDVTGLAEAGAMTEALRRRLPALGMSEEDASFSPCPVRTWNLGNGRGIPVRVTVSEMGPQLLSELLGLTEAQEGALSVAFRVADDRVFCS